MSVQLLVLPGRSGRGPVEVREGDVGDMMLVTRQDRVVICSMVEQRRQGDADCCLLGAGSAPWQRWWWRGAAPWCWRAGITTSRRAPRTPELESAVSSPFFWAAVTGDFKERQERVVEVRDIEPNAMQQVLDYMHGIPITGSSVADLLEAIERFQMGGMKEQVCSMAAGLTPRAAGWRERSMRLVDRADRQRREAEVKGSALPLPTPFASARCPPEAVDGGGGAGGEEETGWSLVPPPRPDGPQAVLALGAGGAGGPAGGPGGRRGLQGAPGQGGAG